MILDVVIEVRIVLDIVDEDERVVVQSSSNHVHRHFSASIGFVGVVVEDVDFVYFAKNFWQVDFVTLNE